MSPPSCRLGFWVVVDSVSHRLDAFHLGLPPPVFLSSLGPANTGSLARPGINGLLVWEKKRKTEG